MKPRRYNRSGDVLRLDPGQTGSAFAFCTEAEHRATGGGFNVNSDPDFKVVDSGGVTTTGDIQGWEVTVRNQNDADGGLQARVTCLDFTP